MKKNINKVIILFDGVCNFCNSWVNFIIKHDKNNRLCFAPLQSEKAQELLALAGEKEYPMNSIVLIENDKIYKQSSAVLRITRYLNGGYFLFSGLLIVPSFIRNAVYNLISRNRYKWFGKKESCMVPTKELKEKFLS